MEPHTHTRAHKNTYTLLHGHTHTNKLVCYQTEVAYQIEGKDTEMKMRAVVDMFFFKGGGASSDMLGWGYSTMTLEWVAVFFFMGEGQGTFPGFPSTGIRH